MNTQMNDLLVLLEQQIDYYRHLRVTAAKEEDWITNSNYAGVIHGLEIGKKVLQDYFIGVC